MSELTELAMKQSNEMYMLGAKHGALVELDAVKRKAKKMCGMHPCNKCPFDVSLEVCGLDEMIDQMKAAVVQEYEEKKEKTNETDK